MPINFVVKSKEATKAEQLRKLQNQHIVSALEEYNKKHQEKEEWFVCGEVYEYDEDGEPDGSITDYLYKGDEATARKKFKNWVNENHEMVKAGKGKDMEYQRYEIGYETKDDTEYVEWAWWGPECNDYDFDASYC